MQTTERTNEAVSRAAIESVLEDDEDFRTDYSGRGMYGATCFGIVTSNVPRTLMLMATGIIEASDIEGGEGIDLVSELAGVARVDSMGLSSIVYFPGYELDS
jgi:hypothetical protein